MQSSIKHWASHECNSSLVSLKSSVLSPAIVVCLLLTIGCHAANLELLSFTLHRWIHLKNYHSTCKCKLWITIKNIRIFFCHPPVRDNGLNGVNSMWLKKLWKRSNQKYTRKLIAVSVSWLAIWCGGVGTEELKLLMVLKVTHQLVHSNSTNQKITSLLDSIMPSDQIALKLILT